ncbi:D-2-hydroxyacid dehydrogenase [Halegenticoccus tardaugens]|uniref:D-2-hydroxyacid dehydrogenase n=1 Tax=Halegenticoccus tardaugens TaxID=2071624 RepID=UPI00100A85D1|nr:D-2-hydroxyacid dehydrogenase [Halegenticoccus tardaugens]
MAGRPTLEQLYVHESVENVIPKRAFVDAFSDLSISAELVGDGHSYGTTDAVVTYIPRPEFLDAAWVHCARAGYDEFDAEAYAAAEVPLTNSSGIHGATVGEVAVGCMLSFARLLHVYRDHQRDREWFTPEYDRPFTVEGETLCVVGLGTIGQGIAQRANALGMDVVGVRRSDDPILGVSNIFDPSDLHEAITDARFVAIALPHTPETDGLFADAEFAAMRDDAYLINVARGPIVDEGALAAALREGELAGAGLDVYETEPLPRESPLWDFEEVIVMPHKGSATNRYHLDIAELVKENVSRYRSGEDLRNRVA